MRMWTRPLAAAAAHGPRALLVAAQNRAAASHCLGSAALVRVGAIAPEEAVLVGGEALYDLVYDGNEDLRGHPGAAAFTASCKNCARCRSSAREAPIIR